MRVTTKSALLLLIVGCFGSATAVVAQTSDSFEVRVQVEESCTITAEDLDFGSYDPNGPVPAVGFSSITAECTLLTLYDVGLDAGANGTSVSDRKMVDDATGSETLDYSLACVGVGVPACALNWGNTPGTDTFTAVGTGLGIPVVVTGTIPAGQQVTPGTYRDNPVVATVYF
jgi:spore coat protein U domain-containing protein, fimbrial subunit CupE1/2/3/6